MQNTWKLAAAVLFLPAALLAQSTFGTILGTVTDSSGAVVPQAKIVITRSANFRANASNPTTSWQYDGRIDEMLTSKQSLFARLSWKDQNTTSPQAFVLPASTSYNNSRSVVVSHNYTLRPTMLNEFRFGLSNEATFTNLPNHPNLNDPGTTITSIAFGRITSARGADSGGNRVGQFALRIEF